MLKGGGVEGFLMEMDGRDSMGVCQVYYDRNNRKTTMEYDQNDDSVAPGWQPKSISRDDADSQRAVKLSYYTTSGADFFGQIKWAVLREKASAASWPADDAGSSMNVRRARFTYYEGANGDDDDAYGNPGDLKLIEIQEPDTGTPRAGTDADWSTVQVYYFRYLDAEPAADNEGKLTYLLEPMGYVKLVAADLSDGSGGTIDDPSELDLVAAGDLDGFATRNYSYNSAQDYYLSSVVQRGGLDGSGNSTDVTKSYVRTWNENLSPSDVSDPYNQWQRKLVIEEKDSSDNVLKRTTSFVNFYDGVLFRIVEEGDDIGTDPNTRRGVAYRYEDSRITWEIEDSAIAWSAINTAGGVDAIASSNNDIFGWASDKSAYIEDSSGVIWVYDFATTTTATTSTAGDVAKYVKTKKLLEGDDETAANFLAYTYIENTTSIDADHVYAVAEVKRYLDASTYTSTAYTYDWFPGAPYAHIMAKKITARQVSSGEYLYSVELFNSRGQLTWSCEVDSDTSPTEYRNIQRREYDDAGRLSRQTDDVSTTVASPTDPDSWTWSTATGYGLHLVTEYDYDSMGRIIEKRGPVYVAQTDGDAPYEVARDATWYFYEENDADAADTSTIVSGYIRLDPSDDSEAEDVIVGPVRVQSVCWGALSVSSAMRKLPAVRSLCLAVGTSLTLPAASPQTTRRRR